MQQFVDTQYKQVGGYSLFTACDSQVLFSKFTYWKLIMQFGGVVRHNDSSSTSPHAPVSDTTQIMRTSDVQ